MNRLGCPPMAFVSAGPKLPATCGPFTITEVTNA